jgi:hypothetical protein
MMQYQTVSLLKLGPEVYESESGQTTGLIFLAMAVMQHMVGGGIDRCDDLMS